MVNKCSIFVLLVILVSFVVMAEVDPVSLVFKQGDVADIKVPCVNSNEYCGVSTACNVTVRRPDTSVWIDNEVMTRNAAFYNYTLQSANVSVIGTYQLQVVCSDGVNSGYDFSDFQITSSGMSGIGQDTLVPGVILIAILVFCGFMAWSLPESENALRLLFVGLSLFMLLIMIQFANLATNEDAVGLTHMLDTTYIILLPVIIFVSLYFVVVKFVVPVILKLNGVYKKRKEGDSEDNFGGGY